MAMTGRVASVFNSAYRVRGRVNAFLLVSAHSRSRCSILDWQSGQRRNNFMRKSLKSELGRLVLLRGAEYLASVERRLHYVLRLADQYQVGQTQDLESNPREKIC